jgi:hypothetical protein
MGTRKYRTVVAAILIGAFLFSPLLCGMTCLDERGVKDSVAAEVAPGEREFVGELVESGVAGCVLTHVVLKVDVSELTKAVGVGAWIWVGFEAVQLVGEIGWLGE